LPPPVLLCETLPYRFYSIPNLFFNLCWPECTPGAFAQVRLCRRRFCCVRLCPTGFIQSQTYFLDCKTGSVKSDIVHVQVARDGEYARYECYDCPANSYQPDQAFIKDCVQCPDGSTTGKEIGQVTSHSPLQPEPNPNRPYAAWKCNPAALSYGTARHRTRGQQPTGFVRSG
jgi:hypothetical protein